MFRNLRTHRLVLSVFAIVLVATSILVFIATRRNDTLAMIILLIVLTGISLVFGPVPEWLKRFNRSKQK